MGDVATALDRITDIRQLMDSLFVHRTSTCGFYRVTSSLSGIHEATFETYGGRSYKVVARYPEPEVPEGTLELRRYIDVKVVSGDFSMKTWQRILCYIVAIEIAPL